MDQQWPVPGIFLALLSYRFSIILPGARDDQPELGGDDGAGDGVLVTSEDGPGGRHLVIIIIIVCMVLRGQESK